MTAPIDLDAHETRELQIVRPLNGIEQTEFKTRDESSATPAGQRLRRYFSIYARAFDDDMRAAHKDWSSRPPPWPVHCARSITCIDDSLILDRELPPLVRRNGHGHSSPSRSSLLLQLGDLSPGGSDELRVGVGMPAEAPAALDRLGEEHPRPAREGWVSGGGGDDVGEFADHG